MNRIEQTQELYERHAGLLACPLCSAAMAAERGSLRCALGHSFDFARQGYVNLFTGRHAEYYDAALFRARSAVCAAGFFGPMLDALTNTLRVLMPQPSAAPGALAVLDAGCGEGSHLWGLLERLQTNGGETTGAGVDIAKTAIQQAARHAGILWAVADLARLPFADESFDAIVNILSPANYAEFGRVLGHAGVLIKVVPGPQYLRELRQALGAAEEYSNAAVAEHFGQRFDVLEQRSVTYSQTLRGEGLRNLARMTPLGWNAPPQRVQALAENEEGMEITVDFLLIAGRRKQ